jgi:flagellar motility protein MotE (MotC chaperone)
LELLDTITKNGEKLDFPKRSYEMTEIDYFDDACEYSQKAFVRWLAKIKACSNPSQDARELANFDVYGIEPSQATKKMNRECYLSICREREHLDKYMQHQLTLEQAHNEKLYKETVALKEELRRMEGLFNDAIKSLSESERLGLRND